MKNPPNAKERGLLKGAIRRVFSRSELRRQALELNSINHSDTTRPRVKKWVFCSYCGEIFPKYLAQVDHYEPLVPVDKALEDMSWDDVINRQWCDIMNLKPSCKDCHKEKTKEENKKRRLNKKARGL